MKRLTTPKRIKKGERNMQNKKIETSSFDHVSITFSSWATGWLWLSTCTPGDRKQEVIDPRQTPDTAKEWKIKSIHGRKWRQGGCQTTMQLPCAWCTPWLTEKPWNISPNSLCTTSLDESKNHGTSPLNSSPLVIPVLNNQLLLLRFCNRPSFQFPWLDCLKAASKNHHKKDPLIFLA